MPRLVSTRSTLIALVLATSLGAPSLAATPLRSPTAGRQPRPAAMVSAGLLTRVRGFLVNLWSGIGCGLDPSGQCTVAPAGNLPPTRTDAGCGIDPSGHCTTAPRVDIGCGLDPNGSCK